MRAAFLVLFFANCTPSPSTEPSGANDAGTQPSADAGSQPPTDAGTSPARAPNILLVIADDLGADVAPCMAAQANRVPMPGIEALCQRGLHFTRTWSNPTCSPTRATMLTGRYSFRTGVGQQIVGNQTDPLPLSETALPQLLKADSGTAYATAAFGKWHLANGNNGGSDHPHTCGFDAYAGLMVGAHQDYYSWRRTENGEAETVDEYSTTRIANDAIAWLDQQTQPWFLWLAFTAPHTPLHAPPDNLHSQTGLVGTEAHIRQNASLYYGAAAEALDREISRILQGIGDEALDNTWVIFVGDNGTPGRVIPAPRTRQRAKGSLYEGGVHVPLIIAGPGISAPGTSIDAPVNLADLHRTIAELAGRDSATIDADRLVDSVSLLPYLHNAAAPAQRQWIYSELFGSEINASAAGRTARNGRYKLIRFDQGGRAFFDLESDPFEDQNLLDGSLDATAQAVHDTLDGVIVDLSGRP